MVYKNYKPFIMLIKKSRLALAVCMLFCTTAFFTITGCGSSGEEKKTEEPTVAPAGVDTPPPAHDIDTTGSGDTGLPRGTKNPA